MNFSCPTKKEEIEESRIICGDAKRVIQNLPKDSIDLIITSPPPPVNSLNKFSISSLEIDQYIDYMVQCISEMNYLIKTQEGSAIILIFREKYRDGYALFYSEKIIQKVIEKSYLNLVDKVPWIKSDLFKNQRSRHGVNAHETCYILNSNSKKLNYNKDFLRVPYKNAIKHVLDDNAFSHAYEKMGTEPLNYIISKERKDTDFPSEVSEYFIGSYSKEGQIVFDPFGGDGVNCESAFSMGRRFIYCDILQSNCKKIYDKFSNSVRTKDIHNVKNINGLKENSKKADILQYNPNEKKEIF